MGRARTTETSRPVYNSRPIATSAQAGAIPQQRNRSARQPRKFDREKPQAKQQGKQRQEQRAHGIHDQGVG